jgi:hypothetical protein
MESVIALLEGSRQPGTSEDGFGYEFGGAGLPVDAEEGSDGEKAGAEI